MSQEPMSTTGETAAATTLPLEFEQGKAFVHTDGTEVRFVEDTWVLKVSSGLDPHASVTFSDLPDWMRHLAKRRLANDWLVRGKSVSYLAQFLTGLRRGATALASFEGPLESLASRHVSQVGSWLQERYYLGLEAQAEAESKKGSSLAPREARAVLRRVGGLGPKAVAVTVSSLNRLLQCARDAGIGIDVAFTVPKGARQRPKRAGGADPAKVLTPDEMAALLTAAQADIDEYIRARETLDRLDIALGNGIVTPESRYKSRLMRFLGANGKEPEALKDIAADEGIGLLSKRHMLPWLTKAVGDAEAEEIWKLRDTMRQRGAKASIEERQRAKSELRKKVQTIDFDKVDDLRQFEEPLLRFFGLRGHRIHSAKEAAVLSGLGPWDLHGYLRRKRIFNDSVDVDLEQAAIDARKVAFEAHGRAIMACALRLLATTARRISAFLLSLPAEPDTSFAKHGDERSFSVSFQAFKMWGDEGLPEDVWLPGYLGEVAEEAIETAKQLTKPLREEADSDVGRYLFIYYNAVGPNGGVRALTAKRLQMYIHSHRGDGLLVRRSVPRAKEISTHWFRHTAGQAITASTGQPVITANFLGNTPEQAATAYCSMGTTEMRRQAASYIEQGRVTGTLFDAAVRLKIAADGSDAEDLPASQLSVEEATERLRLNPNFLWDVTQGDEHVSPDVASEYLKRGIVVNLTARGGCVLPASEGPCPASDECPIGCDPEANEMEPGCGCRWQVLIPHDEAIATLTSDLEALRHQLAEVSDKPEYGAWESHLRTRMAVWETQLARLHALREATASGL